MSSSATTVGSTGRLRYKVLASFDNNNNNSNSISIWDDIAVKLSSLVIVGSVFWGPVFTVYIFRRLWKWANKIDDDNDDNSCSDKINSRQRRRRQIIALMLTLSTVTIIMKGPHRRKSVGERLNFRSWGLWKSWLRYVEFTVLQVINSDDHGGTSAFDLHKNRSIKCISPHGLVPFALGFAALPEDGTNVFGPLRPVVATATMFFPFVRTLLGWLDSIDASRPAVESVLSQTKDSIGIAPGGIAEMFEGYPKPGTHPDEEYCILKNRKGFIRAAIRHQTPVVPIYAFGATKMLRRVQLPGFEYLSNILRVSLCLFYGRFGGLPIPFRQKLMYVVGEPIHPPPTMLQNSLKQEEAAIDEMHSKFCESIQMLFDEFKGLYGWENKKLRLI